MHVNYEEDMDQNYAEDVDVLDYALVHYEEIAVVGVNYPSSAMEAHMVLVEATIDSEHGVVDLLPNSLDSNDKSYVIGVLEMHVVPNFISWHYANLEVPSNGINRKATSLVDLLGNLVRMDDWLLRHGVLVLVVSGGSTSTIISYGRRDLTEVPINEEDICSKGSSEIVVQANVVGFIASETILQVVVIDLD